MGGYASPVSRCARALPLLLVAAVASADKVDDVSRSLLTDSSFRVRAQAALILGKLADRRGVPPLIEALRDDNEAVRIAAAASLGKLGDPSALDALRGRMDDPVIAVRSAAGKAIAALEKAGSDAAPPRAATPAPAAGGARFFLEVSPINAGKASPEVAKMLQEKVRDALGKLDGVALGAPPSGGPQCFYVDGNIVNLVAGAPGADGQVRIDCDVKLVVATYPQRSIKMMATVGGSLDDRNDPAAIESAKRDCLADAAKQAAEKVQTFLQSVR